VGLGGGALHTSGEVTVTLLAYTVLCFLIGMILGKDGSGIAMLFGFMLLSIVTIQLGFVVGLFLRD
jgi:L-cystine uptake protein TcyP (sodium:dicarboxylate symporter family)